MRPMHDWSNDEMVKTGMSIPVKIPMMDDWLEKGRSFL